MENNTTTIQDPMSIAFPASTGFVTKKTSKSFSEKIKGLFFSTGFGSSATANDGFTSTRRNRLSFKMPRFNGKNALKFIIPALIVLIAAFGFVSATKKSPAVAGVATTASSVNTKDVKTVELNRKFSFPLKDATGKSLGTFEYTLESAELRHQIIVKGQTATSVGGRVFLIINLKLVNSLNQGLEINSRDYIRISVNGNDKELFAPEIHNDPVEAQAISTTNTRLGMAINDSDKNIKLQIGEINGKKTIIPLNFK